MKNSQQTPSPLPTPDSAPKARLVFQPSPLSVAPFPNVITLEEWKAQNGKATPKRKRQFLVPPMPKN